MIPGEYPGMDRWYLENIQEWIDGTGEYREMDR